jgi:TPR repeat protein
VRSGSLLVLTSLLGLSACAGAGLSAPSPPEEPAVVIDNPVCVSCGWLLEESQLEHLMEQSRLGDAHSAFRVAMHFNSSGQPDLGVQWLRRASYLGHPAAQYTLWHRLRESTSCVDKHEALVWLERAAAQGVSAAASELSRFRRIAHRCKAEGSGSARVAPNNSSKPTPLRGAA